MITRVLVVGAGVAAVECVLALRELAGSRVALELLAPAAELLPSAAIALTLPLWPGVVTVVLGSVVGGTLLHDGVRRSKQRNDALIDLLRADKAITPTLARIRLRAEALPDAKPTADEDPAATRAAADSR